MFLALLALSGPSMAAEPDKRTDAERSELEQKMCAETKCQKNIHIVLKQKDGTVFDKTFEVFQPIVQDFGIAVVPGQTIYVEADIVNGRLSNINAVDAVRDPSKTITAKFEQTTDGGMMLHITSPFPQTLKFDMGIMPLDADNLFKTSSCPITKGSFELWSDPIFMVVLGNGRVIDTSDGKAMVCH
jgi:hypothetical protein